MSARADTALSSDEQDAGEVARINGRGYECDGPSTFTTPSCKITTPVDCADAGSGGSGGGGHDGGAG